ncbi:hypothetical protein QBC40DRAFT_301174 [Triangularia verruculosa]|uniref:Ankyrin repeat protein n=1 Tax=Triangularia verruculosa TaxID=2587418 RepID=A0AAN6X8L9_9PEZI|nr:hypothetical protein QBC40DRAFT_301174 [Triangularia verruculosa]
MTARSGYDQHDSDSSDQYKDDSEEEKEDAVPGLVSRILDSISKGKNARDYREEWEHLAKIPSRAGEKNNALHCIAKSTKKRLLDEPATGLADMVEYLVRHDNNLLARPNRYGYTALYIAIESRKGKLVKSMCRYHHKIDTVLRIANNHDNSYNNIGIWTWTISISVLRPEHSPLQPK